MDPSSWPEMDSQTLSLEDSGRLRVVSAKVYFIVRKRDIEHFEKVLSFLEETYRLLPGLVAPIKHMKIVFGLKTMVRWQVVVNFICIEFQHAQSIPSDCFCLFVYNASFILSRVKCASLQLIMWMLKRERRMIDTMLKINQFFPNRLPQYQNQCVSLCLHIFIGFKVIIKGKQFFFQLKNQHQIFLMRKNHLDFKDLAQSLAMDKSKLERYVAVSFRLKLFNKSVLSALEPLFCSRNTS